MQSKLPTCRCKNPLWMNHANLSLKELIMPPRTGIEERHCQFFKFTHGWSHFHKKWDDSAYRKRNADGGRRGGEGGQKENGLIRNTIWDSLERQSKHDLHKDAVPKSAAELSFIKLTACYFPFATPPWRSSGWTQSERGGDRGHKLKGSTFTLSALNGGHGNTKVIYAWGQVTPIC